MPGISLQTGLAFQNTPKNLNKVFVPNPTQTFLKLEVFAFSDKPALLRSFFPAHSKQIIIVAFGKTQLCLLKKTQEKKNVHCQIIASQTVIEKKICLGQIWAQISPADGLIKAERV